NAGDPRPTIGIISLGGNYLQSDLTHYWTVTQTSPGPPLEPTVTLVSVNGNVPPAFGTDANADIENTLDLELTGGIAFNADLRFYSAANSFQGFYDAFNQAITDAVKVV